MIKKKNSTEDEQFSDGFTLLMVHWENGNFGEIQKLFSQWSKKKIMKELEKTNNIGNTCLSLAVKNSYHYIAKFLIESGANINHINNAKQPILFIPCWNNDIQMTKWLLESGADVNFMDSRGWTPLMIAVSQGFEDLVEFLLKNNADVNCVDKYGKKAIDKAKSQNIFFLLSSAGIDLRMKQSKNHLSELSPMREINDSATKSSPKRSQRNSAVKSGRKQNSPTKIRNNSKNDEFKNQLKYKDIDFNSTMPRKVDDINANIIKPYSSLKRVDKPKEDKRKQSKTPLRQKYSEKKKEDILKTIYNSIKRNEERMNLAQKNLFSNMINEELLENSNGLYEKLDRAINTYNEKLQKELVNHINLKLKIAWIERGIFSQIDFDNKNVGLV